MDNHYSSFTSLLELLTAFNFAYVLSDDFNIALRDRVIASFESIKKKLGNVKAEVEGHEHSVGKLQPIKEGKIDTAKKLADAKKTINDLNDSYKILEKNVQQKLDKYSIDNRSFSHISLFNALLCMFILLITAFCEDFKYKEEFHQTFFFYIVTCLLYVLIRTISSINSYINNVIPEHGYLNSFFWFAGITGFFFFEFILNYYIFKKLPKVNFLYPNLILMLLVPAAHFIFYFCLAIYLSRKVAAKLNTEISAFKKEIDSAYDNQLKTVLEFHVEAESNYQLEIQQEPQVSEDTPPQ